MSKDGGMADISCGTFGRPKSPVGSRRKSWWQKVLIIARMDFVDANIHIDVVLTDAFQVSLLFSAAIISAWCT